MSSWLLDTNVISEMRRPRPNRKVVEFIARAPAHRLFISIASIAELRGGIEDMEDPISRETLVQWLDHTVRPMFDGRVLAVTEDVLLRSLLIRDFGRKRRHTYSDHALLIAATAVCNGLIIATRNIDDFELTGVPVLNPWTAA